MGKWGLWGLRGSLLALVTAVGGACAGDTPPNDIPAPAVSNITVFYPFKGLVYGRGLPGTFPPSVTHVLVRSHPSGTISLQRVDPDGSFTFSIIAISGDLLEISGALDELGNERGAPTFVQVPPTPVPTEDYVCCQPEGTCYTIDEARAGEPCRNPLTSPTRCESDQDCGVEEREYLSVDLDRIRVGRPNERGRIDVTGFVEPNALVVIENRRLNGIGIPSARSRQAQISDADGGFTFRDIRATGDDELVIQIHDLNRFSSPAVRIMTPDAPLAGVDVLGAFAWEPLANGERGAVALHISPYGVDGRGICPDNPRPPELCLGGGLGHDSVAFARAQMQVGSALVDLDPLPTATTAERPHNRGREGDVRSGPQDVMVVVDMSETASMKDDGGAPLRFDALARFVAGLRQRDRVGLVTYGTQAQAFTGGPGRELALFGAAERDTVEQEIRELPGQPPRSGSDVFAGVAVAARALRAARTQSGRIVVLAAEPPDGTHEEALDDLDAVFDILDEELSTGAPAISVDVVAIEIPDDAANVDKLRDLATFSDGRYYRTTIAGLAQTLTDARSFLSGSFILLYDMDIPDGVGKSGTLELDLEVDFGGAERARTTYTGPLRILLAGDRP